MVNTRHARPRISIRAGSDSGTSHAVRPTPVPQTAAARSVRETETVRSNGNADHAPAPSLPPAASAPARLHTCAHPIALHALSRLRSLDTHRVEFRASAGRLLTVILVEATRDLERRVVGERRLESLARPVVFLSMGSSGLGLSREAGIILPNAVVGNFGRGADDAQLRLHLLHAPSLASATVFVFDPVIRDSARTVAALTFLREHGVQQIRLVGLVASRRAAEGLCAAFPGLQVHAGDFDTSVDGEGFPKPGIGEFPARFHGE